MLKKYGVTDLEPLVIVEQKQDQERIKLFNRAIERLTILIEDRKRLEKAQKILDKK